MSTRGGQIGNTNGAKGKEWLEALRYALKKYEDDEVKRGKALRKIALKVVEDALAGKEAAWKEVAERLDGKVGSTDSSGAVRVLVMRNGPQGPEAARVIEVQPQRLPDDSD
jgi:hypothetical protein